MSPNRAAVLHGQGNLREHLIAAAARLIAERGTAGLTVREIARSAGVADGVLYNHFAAKEELLALALEVHVRAVEDEVLRPDPVTPGTGTVAGNLAELISRGLALHAAVLPAFAGLLAQPKVRERLDGGVPGGDGSGWLLRDLLTGYLRGERDRGRVAVGADVELAATMIIGACHGLVLPCVFGAGPLAIPEGFAARLAAAVLAGIGPR